MLSNVTYMDEYISDGYNQPEALRKVYDTILMTSESNRDKMFRIPLYDIFLNHYEEFGADVTYYPVPEMCYYKPKMMSLSLYGTTEMWLPLMRLNKMRSIVEFNQDQIKIYNPASVKELINIFFVRERKI